MVRTGYASALLAVVVLNFTLTHIAPGDIADTIAGDMGGTTEEVMAQMSRLRSRQALSGAARHLSW